MNDQVRQVFEEDSIAKLADSIKNIGQLAPILVEHQGRCDYKIIGGERRWRATKIAGAEFMVCNILKGLTKTEFFKIQVHENFHEPIPAKDEAKAIKRLWDGSSALGFEFSIPIFANEIGMSETKVRDALNFAENLDTRLQIAVEEGRLPYKIAVRLATIAEREDQFRLAVEILSAKDGFKTAEETIRTFKNAQTACEQPLFAMTVAEWNDNRRNVVEAGIRWAAKHGLAYLQRVAYLVIEKKWMTLAALKRSEEPLIRGWVKVGQQLLSVIEEGEDA